MALRVTQITAEVANGPDGVRSARVTQLTVEVARAILSTPRARTTALSVEVALFGVTTTTTTSTTSTTTTSTTTGSTTTTTSTSTTTTSTSTSTTTTTSAAFVTQYAVELVTSQESNARVEQIVAEIVARYLPDVQAQVTQSVGEIVIHGLSRARVTQVVAELAARGVSRVRVTQFVAEIVAYNDRSNLGVRATQLIGEVVWKLTTTTTTSTSSTSTTSTTTTTSSTTSSSSTTATFTFTFTIPDPRPIGSDRYPFVLPMPPVTTHALSVSTESLPEMSLDADSAIGCGFILGAFRPFDETSRALVSVYVPPDKSVGGPHG